MSACACMYPTCAKAGRCLASSNGLDTSPDPALFLPTRPNSAALYAIAAEVSDVHGKITVLVCKVGGGGLETVAEATFSLADIIAGKCALAVVKGEK